ncbi:MAG: DUF1667 domain-containing protein [Acholeplasmataceae bacterium]|nr:DUF1667 domain-containing protein [Acholeplasmataceae bacterium]
MRDMICIVCPVGCHLHVDENSKVFGNRCPRGENYAIIEITNPKRVLTSTVRTKNTLMPRLSVKSSDALPKALLFDVIEVLNQVEVLHTTRLGDVIVSNVLNTGVDIIATKDVFFE